MRALISVIQIVTYIILVGLTFVIFVRVVDSVLGYGQYLTIFVAVVVWIIAYVCNAIIHEMGHYIGGRLDGYHFLLIQVLWFRIVRFRGNVAAGLTKSHTSQCVMVPDGSEKHWNTYQLMGLVFNIVISLAVAFIGVKIGENGWPFVICFVIAATGMCKIVANGIPFFKKADPVNDCAMFILLNIDKAVREEYFLYLHCYEKYINNYIIGDVKRPEEESSRYYSDVFWREILALEAEEQEK